ncbi:MAG: hypothetical protein IT208_11540 [Chthonomonadales bacterium]|nr:hypothetical protein [Chthonomonadales bacterium]
MSALSTSPKLLRGAIVGVDILNPIPQVIVFQYNPDALTRSLKPRTMGGEGARSEAMRLTGAPEETIKLEVEIDAADQLERGDNVTVGMGIYPQLSALEMLIYPHSGLVIANTVLMAVGTIEVAPPMAPLTLFIWGPRRVLPVRITDFSIAEEAHDPSLNPVRARVSLGLRALSYNDFSVTHPGYALFLAHQVAKEAMAAVGTVTDVAAVAGGNVKLF